MRLNRYGWSYQDKLDYEERAGNLMVAINEMVEEKDRIIADALAEIEDHEDRSYFLKEMQPALNEFESHLKEYQSDLDKLWSMAKTRLYIDDAITILAKNWQHCRNIPLTKNKEYNAYIWEGGELLKPTILKACDSVGGGFSFVPGRDQPKCVIVLPIECVNQLLEVTNANEYHT